MLTAFAQRLLPKDDRFGPRLIALMAVGFAALLAAGIAAAWVSGQTQEHAARVSHTYEVEKAILDVRRLIEEGETTRRGYLLAPGDPSFLAAYGEASAALPVALAQLGRLTADNPVQRQALARLQQQLGQVQASRARSLELATQQQPEVALADFRNGVQSRRMRAVRDTMEAMNAEERRLLELRAQRMRDGVRLFYIILAVAAVLLFGVALASLAMVLTYTRNLTQSRNALRALAAGLEDRVAERTADLSRANEEIQRFAYIVSHDLRSPLVNVMGFTAELEAATGQLRDLVDRAEAEAPDLLTEDARLAAREDLPEAIGFIRTSTQKMDRLINAILQLSRQGRRTLAPEPIDLAAMVNTIGETLAHRLADADATLQVDGVLPVIVSDRFSIDQILSNLIENAVKYLRRGVPGEIVVRGRREGARALIEVADNGRGIDPRDHARVFDLFRRSGAQDQPGEGIGLATVRALVFRLGGVIDVTSTLGSGTTFRLSLPLTLETDKPA